MSKILMLGLAVFLAGSVSADAQGRGNARGRTKLDNTPIRFQEMDRNKDRAITRDEWRGSDQSFKVHDWNNDGKLSAEEVRVGASRDNRAGNADNFDYYEREYVFDDWTDRGFRAHDYNRDNRITRDEWHGSASRFAMLDVNHDGFVGRTEMVGTAAPPDLFTSLDMNRDRTITPNEWQWSRASFDRLDLNRDAKLSVVELKGTPPAEPARSAAYRAGYERGLSEGRQAGREERLANRAWDLEGQSELDTADSGYTSTVGSRADYQTGYREAFRKAYREGWDQAK
jgi:Ca2+-binding EF-hand superfamily protein